MTLTELIERLGAASGGSRELDLAIAKAINAQPTRPPGFGHGIAKTTRYERDLKTCDACGAPATEMRDLSIQLPDYYGFCAEHAAMSDEWERAQSEYNRAVYRFLPVTTSLDAALTLVPENHRVMMDSDCDRAPMWRCLVRPRGVTGTSANGHYGPTAALALCIAALKARAGKDTA